MPGTAAPAAPAARGPAALHPHRKLGLALEILSTYARVRWLLLRTDVDGAVRALRAGAGPCTAEEGEALRADGRRLGRRVMRMLGFLPWDRRCLVRSCVLVGLLARRGVGGRLVIGVRTEPRFEAHAWVECGGVPLLDPGPWAPTRLVEI